MASSSSPSTPTRRRRQPSFDHPRLADALSRATGRAYQGTRLPFQNFTFNDALSAIEMTIDGARWTCMLADYSCRTPEVPPPGRHPPRHQRPGAR